MFGQDSSQDPLAQALWNYVGNSGSNNRIPQIMGQTPVAPGALPANPLASGMPAPSDPSAMNTAGLPGSTPMQLANVANKPPAAPAATPPAPGGGFGFGMMNSAGLPY